MTHFRIFYFLLGLGLAACSSGVAPDPALGVAAEFHPAEVSPE